MPRALLAATLVLLTACVDPPTTDSASAALETDPIQACPLPAPGAIAGHEATFYECAEPLADDGQGCGPSGYLLGYGARYARRFYRETRPRMSSRGQRWIDDVLVCLQGSLRERIDQQTSCDEIWETAFDSHPACYVDAGFCTLPITDILQVVWTIDLRDWLSVDAARQVVTTAASCGRGYAAMMRLFFADLLN